jgi:hypothetical protein
LIPQQISLRLGLSETGEDVTKARVREVDTLTPHIADD